MKTNMFNRFIILSESVFVLLFINLYFFAIIGMLIFPRYYVLSNEDSNKTNNSMNYSDDFDSRNMKPFHRNYEKNQVFGSLKESLLK